MSKGGRLGGGWGGGVSFQLFEEDLKISINSFNFF